MEKVKRQMESIATQEYDSYNVIYVDDTSPSTTFAYARAHISDNYASLKDRYVFENNK